MNGRPGVVVLGFDAMDPAITKAMADDGRLPAFADLLRSAARQPIRNPPGLFVGSLWSTFFTGTSAAQTGFHCWEEIIPGGYERRPTTAAAIRGRPFWQQLSEAGRRVAVLDVPHSHADTPLDGVHVSEWGCHDRHFGLCSEPPELAEQLIARYGLHPILTSDPFSVREWAPDDYVFRAGPVRTGDEDAALLAGLLEGARVKARLTTDLMSDGSWDLFLSVFGETHSVGHQMWHVHDPTHPRHDPAVRARIGDPLAQVYELMDNALADTLAQLEDGDTLLVLLSHGIGPHYDGTHLLPEILRRLDRAYRAPLGRSLEGRILGRVWSAMSARSRAAARRPLAALLRGRLERRDLPTPRDYDTEEERRAQDFFMSPNNFVVGGVRINLDGRESEGRVSPGPDLDELCARLTDDLLALVNVATGAPVVTGVERSDAFYDRDPMDAMPDLFVTWNHDHPIEQIWSPRVGLIQGPYVHWRTGDHRPGGLLLRRGPGTVAGETLPALEIHRLGADIAATLGVTLPGIDDARTEPSSVGT